MRAACPARALSPHGALTSASGCGAGPQGWEGTAVPLEDGEGGLTFDEITAFKQQQVETTGHSRGPGGSPVTTVVATDTTPDTLMGLHLIGSLLDDSAEDLESDSDESDY